MCCLLKKLCNSCGNTHSSCCDNDVDMRIVRASNGCGCNHGGSVVVITNGGCGCGCGGCNGCAYSGYNTANGCGNCAYSGYNTANGCNGCAYDTCGGCGETYNTCGCGY